MILYAEVKLITCEKNNFTDDTGTPVEWFRNFLKGSDGAVLVVNSKIDLTQQEGDTGIASFRLREDGKFFKVSLVGFRGGEKLDLDEEDID